MFIYCDSESKEEEILTRKFISTKIWKKKFKSISLNKSLKSFLNFTASKKKFNNFDGIDFKIYLFFIQFKIFNNSILLINVFQLQVESKLARLTGILFKHLNFKFGKFYLYHFMWKNDLRLNRNAMFYFEKTNSYFNKFINSVYNLSIYKRIFEVAELIKKQFKNKPPELTIYSPFNICGNSGLIVFNQLV